MVKWDTPCCRRCMNELITIIRLWVQTKRHTLFSFVCIFSCSSFHLSAWPQTSVYELLSWHSSDHAKWTDKCLTSSHDHNASSNIRHERARCLWGCMVVPHCFKRTLTRKKGWENLIPLSQTHPDTQIIWYRKSNYQIGKYVGRWLKQNRILSKPTKTIKSEDTSFIKEQDFWVMRHIIKDIKLIIPD